MMRTRDPDPDDRDNDDDPPPRRAVPAPTSAARRPAPKTVAVAQPETPITTGPAYGVTPIAERPKDDRSPRDRAVDNLKRVHAALMAFADDKGYLPRQYSKNREGFPTLSWRVEILPYLGYPDLHAAFNPKRSWDEEPNVSLLRFIPPEYTSPERRDERTNLLAPAASNFVFRGTTTTKPRTVEDGIRSTVFLMEVDDEMAVPWTKPQDYETRLLWKTRDDSLPGLGNLRGDGVFAIWGSGKPLLMQPKMGRRVFKEAFATDDGSTDLPSRIHRDIPAGGSAVMAREDRDKMLTAKIESERPDEPEIVRRDRRRRRGGESNARFESLDRDPVPNALDLESSRSRVEALYADRVRSASRPGEYSRLAADMIRDADKLAADSAGRYALADAAVRTAIRGDDDATLIRAIDFLVRTFDVDTLTTNADHLLAFAAANRNAGLSGRRAFLSRAVLATREAIRRDDYTVALTLARAIPMAVQKGGDIDDTARRLGSAITRAGRTHAKVKDALATYRRDPSDAKAAETVGRYLCFVKGDWDRGLELLPVNDGSPMASVVRAERTGPSSPGDTLSLADAWWDLAESARSAVYRDGARERSHHWYAEAEMSLPESLDRMHARQRLREADAMADGPMQLIRRLADQTGTRLVTSLGDASLGSPIATDEDD